MTQISAIFKKGRGAEMLQAADRLDHYAHPLHDNEFGDGWRHESRQDTGG